MPRLFTGSFSGRKRLGFSAEGLPEAGKRISLWLTSPAKRLPYMWCDPYDPQAISRTG